MYVEVSISGINALAAAAAVLAAIRNKKDAWAGFEPMT